MTARGDGYDVDGENEAAPASPATDATRLDEATALLEQHIERSENDDVRSALRVAISHVRRASVTERTGRDVLVEAGPVVTSTPHLSRGDER